MIKSPLNYTGGKYKLLPQLLPLFPGHINRFVDLFAGGLDVSLNITAGTTICNDINHYVIGLYEYFQQQSIEQLVKDIYHCIDQYGLSKENQDGYLALRQQYNTTHSPLLLFLLVCYGFNHQFRFNSKGEFNNPFGRNRSSYNTRIEYNLRLMKRRIKDFTFTSKNFKDFDLGFMQAGDFIYADPPYRISCGAYNDGKRGFEGWTIVDDLVLFAKLDELNQRGVKFAMSNVTKHKGHENAALIEWSGRYHTHNIVANYSNSNYQATTSDTLEVLVTNY